MKKFGKIICVLLCMTMLALITAGCKSGSGSSSSSGSTKLGGSITFWIQQYGTNPTNETNFLKSITKKFKDETGVTVNYAINDWGTAQQKYTLASTGGAAPDVAEMFWAYTFQKMGNGAYGPMPIDDVVKDVGFDSFYDFAKGECFFSGHWYALPWRGDDRAIAYNTKDFADAGITSFPKTYDELIADSAKLVQKDSSGTITRSAYLFGGTSQRVDQTWFAILAGFGTTMMNSDYTKFTFFNDPKAIASLQFMQDSVFKYGFMPKGVIDPTYDSEKLFMANKTAIVLGAGPGFLGDVQSQAPQMVADTGSAVMPSTAGSDSGITSIGFAAPVCVFKTTKNAAAAKAFLKFFVSKDVQLEACEDMQLVDVQKAVMQDPFFSDSEWFKNFSQQTAQAQPGDMPMSSWGTVDAAPQGPIPTMCMQIVGGQNVQQAIATCKAAIEKIMPGGTN